MAKISASEGQVQKETIRTELKYIPKLVEEKNPMLSHDLDAADRQIINVSNINTNGINGIDVFAWVKKLFSDLQESLLEKYSPASHGHKHHDIHGLLELITDKTKGLQNKGDYADEDHSHSPSDIDGLTVLIENIVEKAPFADKVDTDLFIEQSEEKIKEIRASIDKKPDIEDIRSMSSSIREVKESVKGIDEKMTQSHDSLRKEMVVITKSIPKPEASDEELIMKIIGADDFLIPKKLDGKKITDISGINTKESPVGIELKRQGEGVGIGYVVHMDQVISIYGPPTPSFVRITFSDAN